ncbi:glycoside hydrolase family 32 protein [Microbacterium sp. KSW4-11]|uniref:beta-fructofuranosidase n=1 Tax=Microbacterium gawkjiense TaxID=3067309 RepID=A0ABU3GF67_9MICO|nr:glycoside hydrolase family 32 protein [Microbacterium sp. KSW4-11]MDT3318106.1 glycoside hydrolase family 32 protein [Microbacterium sp. KSW4-11]
MMEKQMRPQFHFTARGWINDPHGITYTGGRYHAFFQYVPDSTSWSLGCSWGHASGNDLFSLTELPPALAPGDGDAGIWSGSVLVTADGSPRIFYTSVSAHNPAVGRVRTATTTDPDWVTWEKGPVVAEASPEWGAEVFRDPVIIADEDGWRMLVGAGLTDKVAAVVGFTSTDGVTWRASGLVASRPGGDREPAWSGSMWECPQIIEIDGQHALIVSVWDQDELYDVLYALGSYVNGTFTADTWGHLSYGPSPYAATTFRDSDGHPCVMFWLRGIEGDGWAGAHSLPYRIAASSNRLSLSPHPDLDLYHDDAATIGSAADILWPEHADTTLKIVHRAASVLEIAREGQQLRVSVGGHSHEVPWVGEVRVVLDGPILEISSFAGVFACPITPLAENWELVGSGLRLRRLRQHAGA